MAGTVKALSWVMMYRRQTAVKGKPVYPINFLAVKGLLCGLRYWPPVAVKALNWVLMYLIALRLLRQDRL